MATATLPATAKVVRAPAKTPAVSVWERLSHWLLPAHESMPLAASNVVRVVPESSTSESPGQRPSSVLAAVDPWVQQALLLACGAFALLTVALGVYSSAAQPATVPVQYDYSAPTFIFLTLLVLDIMFFLFPPAGRPPYAAALCAAVLHLLPFVSYLLRMTGVTPVLAIDSGSSIQAAVPIRYIEWLCNTPIIQVMLGTLGGAPRALTQRVALYDAAMVVAGGAARLIANQSVSIILALLSLAFRVLTMWGMVALTRVMRKRAAGDANTRLRVTMVGAFMVLAFLVYAAVFMAQYGSGIDTETREVAYAFLDVAAKCAATSVLLGGFFSTRMDEVLHFQAASKAANRLKSAFLKFIIRETREPLGSMHLLVDELQDSMAAVEDVELAHGSAERDARSGRSASLPYTHSYRAGGSFSNPREACTTLKAHVASMHAALDDLLTYRALLSNGMLPVVSVTSLQGILDGAIAGMSAAAHRKGLRVHCVMARDVPSTVRTDPALWHRLLNSILTRSTSLSSYGARVTVLVSLVLQASGEDCVQVLIRDNVQVSEEQLVGLQDMDGVFTSADAWVTGSANTTPQGDGARRLQAAALASPPSLALVIAWGLMGTLGGKLRMQALPGAGGTAPDTLSRALLALDHSATLVPKAVREHATADTGGTLATLTVPLTALGIVP